MNVQVSDETIRVTGLQQLNGPSASLFRTQVLASLKARHQVEVDLSQILTVDGGGLGALLSLHKVCSGVRLLNPTPPVRQILELTRMNRVFEIVQN
ncbi:MAG TPA: STAS domain-containing protein [Candidatus Saccharimonadales bacterium]|nr:STAS domain-containing protein [Candidatus Saccharimonadales bacterium]